jgi:hypothetical protein
VHTNKILRSGSQILLAACLLSVAACGGGGGGDGAPSAAAADTGGTHIDGKVSAQFVAGSQARYVAATATSFSYGALNTQQEADGTFHSIGRYSVGTGVRFADIAGDESYAMGTWKGGNYVESADASKAYNNWAFYYAVYNQAMSLPANATLVCTPHLSSTQSGNQAGQVSGSATLSVTNAVAQASVSLSLTPANGSAVPLAQSATFQNGKFGMSIGNMLSSGSGAALALGEVGGGRFVLVAPWKAVAFNGVVYAGIATFTCE